jgi:hypothetical protein
MLIFTRKFARNVSVLFESDRGRYDTKKLLVGHLVRRRKRLTHQDALGGAVSLLTVEKRTHQNLAETRILHNLLTPLGFWQS